MILAIVPANQDVAPVDILERALRDDPTGARTSVVRTKPDGTVCALEERWNGKELMPFAPFRFSRRVNGIISCVLTPLL